MKEQLDSYLYDVENLARGRINELIILLAEKENINENLKNNQMLWASLMNNIKSRAEKIIFRDYIYTNLI